MILLRTRSLILRGALILTCVVTNLVVARIQKGDATASATLKQTRAYPLENVSGRIDHLALDRDGQRLFVAELGNGSVEVIDLASGKPVGRIGEMKEPQGIANLAAGSASRIVFACGGDGTCRRIDALTLNEIGKVNVGRDADNVRVDAKTGLIYVGFDPGIAVVESGQDGLTKRGEIPLAGHAESFQLEQNGPRIFVNVPEAKQIQIVDREKKSIVANWTVTEARDNYPMALDEEHHRLFVVCRTPARLLVIDTESGSTLQALECVGDADDAYWSAAAQRLYVSGGEGYIDVFGMQDAGKWMRMERVKTASGARTSLLDPDSRTLYLAVPRHGDQRAEIRAFHVSPSQSQ